MSVQSDCNTASVQLVSLLIERGAADVAHGHGTLIQHLVATHDALALENAPLHLRRAGLFHSVYGTQFYPAVFQPNWTRWEVQHLIGEAAERLVYLFALVARAELQPDRPSEGAGTMIRVAGRDAVVRLTWATYRDLCQIANANASALLADESAARKTK